MNPLFHRLISPDVRRVVAEDGATCAPFQPVTESMPDASANDFFAGGEETANWVTHGIGLVLSIAGFALLVMSACLRGDVWHVVSFTVFGLTLLLLYAASTIYHAHPGGRAKALFLKLDHAAIFLLIAGTSTPFLLTSLRGPWGWSLFGVIWALCVAGIFLQRIFGARYPLSFTVAYL
ncbi:MAG TPA: hemolysin III family protein, partial [Rariglobus sp.]